MFSAANEEKNDELSSCTMCSCITSTPLFIPPDGALVCVACAREHGGNNRIPGADAVNAFPVTLWPRIWCRRDLMPEAADAAAATLPLPPTCPSPSPPPPPPPRCAPPSQLPYFGHSFPLIWHPNSPLSIPPAPPCPPFGDPSRPAMPRDTRSSSRRRRRDISPRFDGERKRPSSPSSFSLSSSSSSAGFYRFVSEKIVETVTVSVRRHGKKKKEAPRRKREDGRGASTRRDPLCKSQKSSPCSRHSGCHEASDLLCRQCDVLTVSALEDLDASSERPRVVMAKIEVGNDDAGAADRLRRRHVVKVFLFLSDKEESSRHSVCHVGPEFQILATLTRSGRVRKGEALGVAQVIARDPLAALLGMNSAVRMKSDNLKLLPRAISFPVTLRARRREGDFHPGDPCLFVPSHFPKLREELVVYEKGSRFRVRLSNASEDTIVLDRAAQVGTLYHAGAQWRHPALAEFRKEKRLQLKESAKIVESDISLVTLSDSSHDVSLDPVSPESSHDNSLEPISPESISGITPVCGGGDAGSSKDLFHVFKCSKSVLLEPDTYSSKISVERSDDCDCLKYSRSSADIEATSLLDEVELTRLGRVLRRQNCREKKIKVKVYLTGTTSVTVEEGEAVFNIKCLRKITS